MSRHYLRRAAAESPQKPWMNLGLKKSFMGSGFSLYRIASITPETATDLGTTEFRGNGTELSVIAYSAPPVHPDSTRFIFPDRSRARH